MGGVHFAQQNNTALLLNRYNVFQFIGVDHGGREVDGPLQERDAKRLVI